MKTLLLFIVILIPVLSRSQSTNASDLLEGGKTLIELIKVFKPQRSNLSTAAYSSPDSCSIKKIADISYKNKTDKLMIVSLYFRAGSNYEAQVLSLKLTPSSQETLYDIRSGIYKYKIESDLNGQRILLHEGELKIAPCEKAVKDIKE